MTFKKNILLFSVFIIILLAIVTHTFSSYILSRIGGFLIVDEQPVKSDAAVVLNTGVEYYPRLIEAAQLYRKKFTEKVVINGNRKTDVLRELERRGFRGCCRWDEDRKRILELLGVPRMDVISVSAEDAYDTASEAKAVGYRLVSAGIKKIIIATSKSHTRRAQFIWNRLYGDRLEICAVSAKSDPYDPKGWWKDGRQIRWVLAEYGAWIYYWWKS